MMIEELTIDALIEYVGTQLPIELARTNAAQTDHVVYNLVEIYDQDIDPREFPSYPSACVFIDESDDAQKDRALRLNIATVKIQIAYQGHVRLGYRYLAALTSIIMRDRTLGMKSQAAQVVKRKYYAPVSGKGDDEIRIAEAILSIEQEVRRT